MTDAPRWYLDQDGDGFGISWVLAACAPPAGYANNASDCDDSDAAIHPGALEHCDGVDEDCGSDGDGGTLAEGPTWHTDADRDGYGAPGEGVMACESPDGDVGDGSDCDDTDPSFHPGARDLCDDGLDQDCDGDERICVFGGVEDAAAEAYATITGDEVDGLGSIDVAIGDLDGDGGVDVAFLDMAGANSYRIIHGPLAAGDTVASAAVTSIGSPNHAYAIEGHVVAADVSGDGEADLLIGNSYDESVAPFGGYIGVFLGPVASGVIDVDEPDVALFGDLDHDLVGGQFQVAGDLDGDQKPDIVALACRSWTGANCSGDAMVVPAEQDASVDVHDVANTTISSDHDGESFVLSDTAPDLDGDGERDLALGDPYDGVGSTVVFLGPLHSGHISASDADAVYYGEALSDLAGYRLAAGDFDGDGTADLVVGSSHTTIWATDTHGRAYVVTGPVAAGSVNYLRDAPIQIDSPTNSGFATTDVAMPDIDGDGKADVAVGAFDDRSYGYSQGGAVYLFYGGLPSGAYWSTDADGVLFGSFSPAAFGESLSVGDLDGDGLDDLLVGSPGYKNIHGSDGRFWLFRGD